jgi:hypothetical protein
VDLQLVLAVDCSGSVNADRYALQMEGMARAFANPAVLDAIRSGPTGAIAVALFQWSGADRQHLSVPWTEIRDEESIGALAAALHELPRTVKGGPTSVSGALEYAERLLGESPFDSSRRVVDVSGDGSNNNGSYPEPFRDRLVRAGVVVNGLAILTGEPTLDAYYRDSVAGGPGSFVIQAQSFEAFGDAILEKLVREIAADAAPHVQLAGPATLPAVRGAR